MSEANSSTARAAEARALWTRLCEPLTHIPLDDIRAAAGYRDELVPLLLDTVHDGVVNEAAYVENPTRYGPILGMLFLAQFREQRGCAAILAFFRRPDDVLDLQVGDMATDDLPDLICSTYDGNFEALKAIVEDDSVGAHVAESVIHAAGSLCRADLIDLDDLRSWFADLFNRPRSATTWIAGALATESAIMSFKSLRGYIAGLYDGGFIDDDLIPKAELARVFAGDAVAGYPRGVSLVEVERRIERWIDMASEDARLVGPWHTPDSPVAEVDGPSNDDRGSIASPFQRAESKVGRNDPCPCGSGRKYKKCCGDASR